MPRDIAPGLLIIDDLIQVGRLAVYQSALNYNPSFDVPFANYTKRGIKKRVPFFFTTLENRMQFSLEELAFVRSDEALYADGDISDFVAWLKRQYQKSGSGLDYEQWIRQSWLSPGSAQRV